MIGLLAIEIDQRVIEKRFQEELQKRLSKIEQSLTFWDMKELCRRTCMSENSIKEKFFHDERFPKYKLSGKWYFPAAEAESFLLEWIKEQPTH